MTRTRAVLIALTLALLVPSSASAEWLPIENLADIQRNDFTSGELAFDANDRGDAVVLVLDARGIRAYVSKRGGPFGPARQVPGVAGNVAFPGVLLNEDGRALIHWRRSNPADFTERAYVVGMKVDGGFGTTRPVTPTANGLMFEPAIGPGGRFAIVYATGPSFKPLYGRAAPPSGKLGARRTIAAGRSWLRAVWYPGARPYVAFTRTADNDTKLFERRVDPPAASRQIASLPRFADLKLDTASNGMQAALWSGGNTEGPERPLVAAVRRTGEKFKTQTIADRLPPQVSAVAVSRSGAAMAAWRDFNESTTEDDPAPTGQATPGRIFTSYRAPGGAFRQPRDFRPDTERADIPGLSIDISSDGLAALGFKTERYAGIQGRPHVVLIRAGGEPEITPIGDIRDTAGGAAVEVDERERVTSMWTDSDRVHAMRGDFGR
jgi:hypothetical protein